MEGIRDGQVIHTGRSYGHDIHPRSLAIILAVFWLWHVGCPLGAEHSMTAWEKAVDEDIASSRCLITWGHFEPAGQ